MMHLSKCVAVALLAAGLGQAGPPGSIRCPANGKTYKFVAVPGGLDWNQAFDRAQRSDNGWVGRLAMPRSFEVDRFLVNTYGDRLHMAWLGGQRPRNSNRYETWRWIDGREFGYTNWKAGCPNNSGGKEDRLMYWRGYGSQGMPMSWEDNSQNGTGSGYVVEYPN